MPKRILSGRVVSDKNNKTLIVRVERTFKHPRYHKIVRVSKKYAVHDSESMHKEGDFVKIEESRPISKTKKWKIVS